MEPKAYEELYLLESEHWWYQGMRIITQTLLKKYLPFQEPYLILDAGCGTGGNLTALSPLGKVMGIDYSPLALDYARHDHRDTLARATVEALPYSANTFDLVTSFDVIYAREVIDDQIALTEFARVTRPGGYVLVRVPAFPSLRGPHDAFVHGIRRYTTDELRLKMNNAMLFPLHMTYANSLLMPLIFIARKLQTLSTYFGSKPSSDVNPTPIIVNQILKKLLYLEAGWIGYGRRFPVGVSLFCLAEKRLPVPTSQL